MTISTKPQFQSFLDFVTLMIKTLAVGTVRDIVTPFGTFTFSKTSEEVSFGTNEFEDRVELRIPKYIVYRPGLFSAIALTRLCDMKRVGDNELLYVLEEGTRIVNKDTSGYTDLKRFLSTIGSDKAGTEKFYFHPHGVLFYKDPAVLYEVTRHRSGPVADINYAPASSQKPSVGADKPTAPQTGPVNKPRVLPYLLQVVNSRSELIDVMEGLMVDCIELRKAHNNPVISRVVHVGIGAIRVSCEGLVLSDVRGKEVCTVPVSPDLTTSAVQLVVSNLILDFEITPSANQISYSDRHGSVQVTISEAGFGQAVAVYEDTDFPKPVTLLHPFGSKQFAAKASVKKDAVPKPVGAQAEKSVLDLIWEAAHRAQKPKESVSPKSLTEEQRNAAIAFCQHMWTIGQDMSKAGVKPDLACQSFLKTLNDYARQDPALKQFLKEIFTAL